MNFRLPLPPTVTHGPGAYIYIAIHFVLVVTLYFALYIVYIHACSTFIHIYVLCVIRGMHNALGPGTSVSRCGSVGLELRAGNVINSDQ